MNLWNKKVEPLVIDSKPTDDVSTHDFIRGLIRRGTVEIRPRFDKAGIRYPDVEEYFKGSNLSMLLYALESLVSQGVLKEVDSTRMLTCPNCNSSEVHSKFTCPKCGSDEVSLTQLLEHKECGYIGSKKDFAKAGDLACPRCQTAFTSKGTEFRSIGNFYQCEKCSNRFDKPEVVHVCQNCKKTSTFQDIKYIKIPSYAVSNDILSELTSEFPLLENWSSILESQGFSVKLHDSITGVSGTQSSFDLIAEKDGVRIVIDASVKGNKSDIIAFLAKKIDVNPTKALLIDLSGGVELAAFGKIYGIDVLSVNAAKAQSDKSVPRELEQLIASLSVESKTKQVEKRL